MKVVGIVAAGLLLALSGFAASERPMDVEDVLALSSVADPQISPDGRYVAYVVTERDEEENINDSDIWIVATEDGDPIRLTYHKGSDDSPLWAPDGSWLGFLSDRGEKKQVFGIRLQGGEAWPVTDWKTDVESFHVSPDGARIAFVAKSEKSEEQEKFEKERGRPHVWDEVYPDDWSHLWVAALVEGRAQEAEQFSPDNLYVSGFVWAPDSKRLAFAGRPSPALRARGQGNVYIANEAGGESRQVTSLPGGESPVAWTEAQGLLVSGTGQVLGTYNGKLWKVPVSGGEAVSLTDDLDENAGYVAISRDRLLVEASMRTGRGLFGIDLNDGKAERLTDEARFLQSFSATKDGSKLAFLASSGSEPTNVYVSNAESFTPKRLTDINSQLTDFQLGEQRVVRWDSRADGEGIEGILTLPVGYREGERVPLLLVIHGGPSGVSSDRFPSSRSAYPIQVFAGKGYAVLQPNYRGSTGYGERFRGLNRGDISGRDWIDIDSGVDALIERGIADPDRLGIMGWSFGGHHTYWGITQTDRYKAASAGAGANDLISMYSQTDLPEFYHTYLGPKPWEDFDLYEERSAYRNVANVTTPLLIQVGEKDERVPAEQSIQFYEAVKALGKVETKLVIYPGQPHGVRDPRLVRDLMLRNVDWFTRWIPPGRAGTTDGGR